MWTEYTIKLYTKPNHINEFLTHWTGRNKSDSAAFDILSRIVDTGELKLSINKISFPDSTWEIFNQTICFTDTPIKQSLDHCKRYNYFGISFDKNELMEYGANPVFYLVKNRQRHQDFMITVRPINNENKNLISWVNSCLQPYDTKKFSQANWAEFYEREWRIVRVLPSRMLDLMEQTQGKIKEYPFKMKIRRVELNENFNQDEFYLPFDRSIIKNIIVPGDFDLEKARDLMQRNNLNCELLIIER